ncbi:HAMP domain-containing histidine kinase [bacterium]|nr:HAMP domain-containing histidine kinase [bacterium]
MPDLRDPRRERRRVALAFLVAVVPPLGVLAYLSWFALQTDRIGQERAEEEHARSFAQSARTAIAQAVRNAEEACFPQDVAPILSRDPQGRLQLERTLELSRTRHPIASRFLAIDEEGKVLLPEPRAPYRPEGSPPPAEDPDEAPSPEALAARRRASAAYDQALASAERGDLAQAATTFLRVAEDQDAPATLRARAAFRRARALEGLGNGDAAAAAYARAAGLAHGIRDESGSALRPLAVLRRAELLKFRSEPLLAFSAARDLARALLAGELHGLSSSEWESSLKQARGIVDGIAAVWSAGPASQDGDPCELPTAGAALLAHAEADVRARLARVKDLEGELGEPLRAALKRERPGELLHLYSSMQRPPILIAYRAVSVTSEARSQRIVFGVEVDLEVLAREVIGPVCVTETRDLPKEAAVALAALDPRGVVRAYAGAEAAPDELGHTRETDAVQATVALDPPPLWQLRALRSSEGLAQKTRQRAVLFFALFALALVAAAAGGTATLRSVTRSLELARMKQDFVSNVTHELKTPLTSIRMYAETLALGRAKEEKRKKYLESIIKESDRLQRMIEDILDFARLGEGKRPWVLAEHDVAEAVREAIDLFRHSAEMRGFELYLDLPAIRALPPVDLDRDALVRAVLNLLTNAVKYSGESRYVRVAVAREGDSIAVSVEDKGVGIETDDLERIFERFYRAGDPLTREVKGAGLGLALVDEVVRAHEGKIRVESERGKGSTFTILLPIVKDYRNVMWPPPVTQSSAMFPQSGPAPGTLPNGGSRA